MSSMASAGWQLGVGWWLVIVSHVHEVLEHYVHDKIRIMRFFGFINKVNDLADV